MPLRWFQAFLDKHPEALQKEYSVAEFLGEGTRIRITLDASVWGVCAYLEEDDVITEYI